MLLQKGFSLLEVGAALLILGLAVTSIFQFISSTTLSAFDLEERAMQDKLQTIDWRLPRRLNQ
jgi:prepilin-type N-terminal cleavage/methylation domain-containing protein